MYSFPNFEPVCCYMSGSNHCFMTCIQVSQEAGKVVCYLISLRIFHSLLWSTQSKPFVSNTVKGFCVVNETEVDFFWNSLAFSMIQWMFAVWCLVPVPFLNPAYTSESSWFKYCWNLAWRFLSITLLAREVSANVWQFEHCLALPFFGTEIKPDLFQSCGLCWVFQTCWHIECSTLTASSFSILNSSSGIPTLPLPLLVILLPKAHLISHSRMSCPRWMTTPLWLSGSSRPFLYSFFGIFLSSILNLFCLLSLFCFCPSCPFLHEMFLWYFQFSLSLEVLL